MTITRIARRLSAAVLLLITFLLWLASPSLASGHGPATHTKIRRLAVTGTEYNLDYAYGTDSPLQSLTAHWWTGRTDAPWVLLIHGGSWTNGTRANMQAEADMFYSRGWQVFNMDYRRGADTNPSADDQRTDVQLARTWINGHRYGLHIDMTKGTIFGFSAGGQLAAQGGNDVPFSSVVLESGAIQPQRFAEAVINGSTDSEINYIYAREQSLTGCEYSIDPATDCGKAWLQFEPERGLGAQTPPTYVMYGDQDPLYCDAAAKSYYYWLGYHSVTPRVLVAVAGLGHTNQVLLGSEDRIHNLLVWIGAQW